MYTKTLSDDEQCYRSSDDVIGHDCLRRQLKIDDYARCHGGVVRYCRCSRLGYADVSMSDAPNTLSATSN